MFLYRNLAETEIAIEKHEERTYERTGLTKGDGISREENCKMLVVSCDQAAGFGTMAWQVFQVGRSAS